MLTGSEWNRGTDGPGDPSYGFRDRKDFDEIEGETDFGFIVDTRLTREYENGTPEFPAFQAFLC